MISTMCKKYRQSTGTTQQELGNVKNISAFENGRSTNINHLIPYMKLAMSRNEVDHFVCLIKDDIKRGGRDV